MISEKKMIVNFLEYLTKQVSHAAVSTHAMFIICLALFAGAILLILKTGKNKYKLPPGPTGVPILGYLPFLGQEPHKELDKLKKIYGNVFSLYLGRDYVVILGDYEAVKEAFSKSETLARPDGLFDVLPDRAGFTTVNGEEWVEQRKFCAKSMREHGLGRDKWESLIQIEVEDFIKRVSSFGGKAVDVSEILTSSASNNITTFVLGKHLPFDHPDRKFLDNAMNEIMHYFNLTSNSNFFPVIRRIAALLGVGNTGKIYKITKILNSFLRKEVEKLKETYQNGDNDNFIVDYLKEMDNNKGKSGHYFNETNLYGNIQTLFLGGSDTTRNSIYWLLLIIANFPEIQSKVQHELDHVMGKDGIVQWSERKQIPYTFATVMEAQRWRTLAPLNTPRITTEDIKVQTYDIPKGTSIIANNWGLHNDPKYWTGPHKFDPGRFLTEDGKDVKIKLDSYNPFSYGKRNCPGDRIAMMEILMYFSALMQNFKISVPKGKKVNLKGELGLTYRAVSQELHFTPRE